MIMMTKKWKKESWGLLFVGLTLRFLEHFILNGPDPKALDAVLAQLNDPKRQNPQELDRAVIGKPAHVSDQSMINNILISHSLTVVHFSLTITQRNKKEHVCFILLWKPCGWIVCEICWSRTDTKRSYGNCGQNWKRHSVLRTGTRSSFENQPQTSSSV